MKMTLLDRLIAAVSLIALVVGLGAPPFILLTHLAGR